MSLSDFQSDNLSPTVIQYPYIQLANKQEPNAPPSSPPPRPIAASESESACVSVTQGETNAQAATDNENDNDNFQMRVRCLVPTLGTPSFLNFSYDKFYFPTELCVDWNILHGASVPSFAFTAAISRSEAIQHEQVSDVFKRFTLPPRADFSLLSFLQQHPTRAMAYIQFLTPLQEAFSQRVESLELVANKSCTQGMVFLLMFGSLMLMCGLPVLITVSASSCDIEQNDEQKSSQNGDEQTAANCSKQSVLILGAVMTVIGLVLILCGAVRACKQKRLFLQELEKKSSLTLCGQDPSESANLQTRLVPCGNEQQQEQQQQQLKGWHAEVRFEAGAETFSVVACLTISWKTCNEQCAQHRASCPLVQVVVDRNGSAHTQSQSLAQSQSQSH